MCKAVELESLYVAAPKSRRRKITTTTSRSTYYVKNIRTKEKKTYKLLAVLNSWCWFGYVRTTYIVQVDIVLLPAAASARNMRANYIIILLGLESEMKHKVSMPLR